MPWRGMYGIAHAVLCLQRPSNPTPCVSLGKQKYLHVSDSSAHIFFLLFSKTVFSPSGEELPWWPASFIPVLEPIGLTNEYLKAFEGSGLTFEVRSHTAGVYLPTHCIAKQEGGVLCCT